jgi:hypothetical protein
MAKLTPLQRAIREAGKKLPFKSANDTNEMLEFAADDMAEAYQIGAEEAQHEIVRRLMAIEAEQ